MYLYMYHCDLANCRTFMSYMYMYMYVSAFTVNFQARPYKFNAESCTKLFISTYMYNFF